MKSKMQYLSFLNVISCIAVIMLHTNGCFWAFSHERYWVTANVIESVMYFAVPVFFMISGATLIDYRERYSTKTFMKKRIKKTVIPFLFWSLFGLIYMTIKYPENPSNFGIIHIVSKLINTQIISIYWFFMPLFSVYMSIPIISLIPKEQRKEKFLYLVIISFITSSLIPFVCSLIDIQYNNSLMVQFGNSYMIYVIVGYLIDNYEIPKKLRIFIYVFSFVGLGLHLFGTYYLSINSNRIIDTFKGYNNVPCFIYSVGIFVFFKYFKVPLKLSTVFNRIINLSKYTFGAYLMHFFIIDISLEVLKIDNRNIYFRVFAPFVIFIICIFIENIVKKVPLLRTVLP